MKTVIEILETYLTVLVHPFRIHQQFRYSLPLPDQHGHVLRPLSLAESLGVSWIFAIIRGICKILILNFLLQTMLSLQGDNLPLFQELIKNSSQPTYYFLLFSAALDIIFFPIAALVLTEVWAWVIRLYAGWLNPELPKDEIADQITTHALSSNLFTIIPFLGDVIQSLLYYFLLYAGLRSNLGASRSLAWVILLTPTLVAFMLGGFFLLAIIYLVT